MNCTTRALQLYANKNMHVPSSTQEMMPIDVIYVWQFVLFVRQFKIWHLNLPPKEYQRQFWNVHALKIKKLNPKIKLRLCLICHSLENKKRKKKSQRFRELLWRITTKCGARFALLHSCVCSARLQLEKGLSNEMMTSCDSCGLRCSSRTSNRFMFDQIRRCLLWELSSTKRQIFA